ncbi:uncharacterized protein JCM6883_003082 [Sporobolomyces salmoneus]|uniref:uncharacterized protein n=1 Tax=Sporobolomyces salmoneus TaxID=183962 RepID=UPI00316CFBE7
MDLPSLYTTLADLRLALPATLLGTLLLRWLVKGFLDLMDSIQSQGWEEEDGLFGAEPEAARTSRNTEAEDGGEEDEVVPVVVKSKTMRNGLVLGLMGMVATTYFADGVAQVIATLIRSRYTPSDPLYQNIVYYSAGGLSAFCILGLGLAYEAKLAAKKEKEQFKFPKYYPRLVVILGFALDVAVLSIYSQILVKDKTIGVQDKTLPFVHLGIFSFRILLYTLLFLSQTPLLYRSAYSAPRGASDENTSLLSGSTRNGYSAIPTSASTSLLSGSTPIGYSALPTSASNSPLRSTKPPSNRPDDPQSLSILTLFTRVKTLFPYLWPSKSFSLQVIAVVCFALMIARRYFNVAAPIFFGRIISDLSNGRAPYGNLAIYVTLSFLQDSNSMLYRFLWLPISQYSELEMSMMAFDTLLNLSLSYHQRRRTGELLRILGRTDAINDFFELLLFDFIPVLVDLPVAVVVLSVRYGATIVGVVTLVSIVYVGASVTLAESRTKLYRSLRDESQFMHQIKTDTLFNFETVKTTTSESFEKKRLKEALRRYQKGYWSVYSAWNSLSLLQNGISAFGLLVCSFILAHRVVIGEMDIGNYVTFISYLNQLYSPLNRIASLYRQTMQSLVDTEQLMTLLSEDKDIVDRPNSIELSIDPDKGEGGEIEFKDVVFSYDGKKDVLKGISFKVEKGQSVALVGSSGGGKSTVMRLLYRFYEATGGGIFVNGHDIRDLTQQSLRFNIGLVPQDPVLFNETARYNIAYGGIGRLNKPNAELTMDEVVAAAKDSSMHDKIMSFPDQYETRVGERGMRLSGGEKQRVAIARTILKNPPILLLDEATSALDTHNERAIQTRLRELSKGRTTLSIAHRLSTIADCDVIYVLDEGVIAEFGSHSDLLAKDGVYAQLWQKQSSEDGEGSTASQTPIASGSGTPASKD